MSAASSPMIFCALDTPDLAQAKAWAETIGPVTGALKVGMEFVNAYGPHGIETVQNAAPDAELFIDLKYHDIPNTVAGAVRAVCQRFAPAYLNVHAAGGIEMMQAAKDACTPQTKLLAVTILTSLNQEAIRTVGYEHPLTEQVTRMAKLTQDSGLDGVVCSALEIEPIRALCGNDFDLMVPGIRPAGSQSQDQKRVMTPEEALGKGATHLVIGRPITGAADPAQAAQDILESIRKDAAA
ncbi:MAG: orotidine-5'-phosphate decarboxylase [Alphaproteobacteria bacterium]|nr:orotidine-5'-phosphate decarboxylase [Alphaproteobacteria bacterium]